MRSVCYPTTLVLVFTALMAQQNSLGADVPRFLFGPAQLVEGISTPGVGEDAPSPTPDELELFFGSNSGQAGRLTNFTWHVVSRSDSHFGSPVPLVSLNTDLVKETQPSISNDGLTIYYMVQEEPMGDDPSGEIWSACLVRLVNEPFGNPSLLFSRAGSELDCTERVVGWALTVCVESR